MWPLGQLLFLYFHWKWRYVPLVSCHQACWAYLYITHSASSRGQVNMTLEPGIIMPGLWSQWCPWLRWSRGSEEDHCCICSVSTGPQELRFFCTTFFLFLLHMIKWEHLNGQITEIKIINLRFFSMPSSLRTAIINSGLYALVLEWSSNFVVA